MRSGRRAARHLHRRRAVLLRPDHRRGDLHFFVVALSGFTKAWQLYLGLFFVLMVVYAPGGVASLILMQIPIIRAGPFR